MTDPAEIELRTVTKAFRTGFSLGPLELAIRSRECFCIVGPSGSGKSTLLGLVGGWIFADGGRITIAGTDVTGSDPNRRPIRACFQKGGYLFPHMSVRDNVGYALRIRGCPKKQVFETTKLALHDVDLDGFEDRTIGTLSGGEIQRVSIARALADPQPILLLDEITAGLDRPLRATILTVLENLVESRRLTVVCVSHDVDEAFRLCNRFDSRLGVLNAGKLEQVASPRAIYSQPVSSFVASLVGDVNLLPIAGQTAHSVLFQKALGTSPLNNVLENARWLAVRPEHVYLKKPANTPTMEAQASVEYVDTIGPVTRIRATIDGFEIRILLTEGGEALENAQVRSIFFDLSKARLLQQ